MQDHMNLETLLKRVIAENGEKRDFVTSTQDNIRMVQIADEIKIVLLKDGAMQLEEFSITENAHRQIAGRLEIPFKYYGRLLQDHPDMVMQQVNQLFEREPKSRMIRVLGNKVRAFLSDRYRALDNKEVLEATLPAIYDQADMPTQVLGGNVTDDHMNLKVLFTGDDLASEITRKTRTGQPRIIRPGFRLTNSETGNGSLKFEAFFYDSYCLNGCVFGKQEGFSFSRNHIGGKLIEGVDYQVVSDETRELQDRTIIAEVRDGVKALSDRRFVDQMAEQLRAAANTESAQNPIATVETAVKELSIKDGEKDSILATFLADQDFSKWGLASAVTSVANDSNVATLERANELEDIGSQILSLDMQQWHRLAIAA